MWSLFSEPIQKDYYAGWLSRSWCLSVSCCVFAFVIPILVLISIGYSWNSYQYSLVQPILSFQNYQAACLLSSGVVTYDSSFTNEPTTNSYQTFISAGGDGSDLIVNAVMQSANVSACNLLLYFQVTLSNRLPTIAVLPLQFYRNTANNALGITAVKEWGIIQTHLLSAIPQSSIVSGQELQYFMNNTQRLTTTDTHQTYGMNKNVSLSAKIGGSQVTYGSATSGMNYQGRFTVQATSFLQEVSLLSNLRTFVPHFIYVFILLWVFLAQPTIRWMLQNKIYRSKVSHHKVKQH